jgi:hypothetical protein
VSSGREDDLVGVGPVPELDQTSVDLVGIADQVSGGGGVDQGPLLG